MEVNSTGVYGGPTRRDELPSTEPDLVSDPRRPGRPRKDGAKGEPDATHKRREGGRQRTERDPTRPEQHSGTKTVWNSKVSFILSPPISPTHTGGLRDPVENGKRQCRL